MKIYVDADACPVVAIVEQIAKEYEIPVTLLCDTNHVLYSDYSEVVTVGAGADAVDFKLVSLCHKGDIVVTQDYGVAAMILGKGAYGIHQNGKWYTNENIDRMLMERHLAKKNYRNDYFPFGLHRIRLSSFVLPYILCYFISYHIIFSSGYLFHIIQFEYCNLLSWIFSREQIHTYDLICEHQLLHCHQIRYILI